MKKKKKEKKQVKIEIIIKVDQDFDLQRMSQQIINIVGITYKLDCVGIRIDED
ncbi:MAG: hypothetical protein ACRCZK_01885 [Oscillospiraceae bacterium]